MDVAIRTLEKYVNLPSGSNDKLDADALAKTIAEDFSATGMQTRLIPGLKTGAVLECVYGHGSKRLMLMGHMDTVFPHHISKQFRTDGKTAWGSGVSDMKGGIVVMLYAFKKALPAIDPEKYSVIALINADEEIGSPESSVLIRETAEKCFTALSFEPAGASGRLTCERKGVTSFTVTCRGVGGHAGAAYKMCASAIQALSLRIVQLYALRDDMRDISVNIGRITGGTAENVVADQAAAYGEYRYYDNAYKQDVADKIKVVCAQPCVPHTTTEVTFGTSHPALKATPGSLALYERAQTIAKTQGRTLLIESTGGAGDIAIAGLACIPVLDGFGLEGGQIHTTEEYADISKMPQNIDLAARLIMELLP